MKIRPIELDDAAGMIVLNTRLSQETSFMLMEPSEVCCVVEDQRKLIERVTASDHEQVLVAVDELHPVGFAAIYCKPFVRVRHCFSVVVGIERLRWGEGLGTRILKESERWAKSKGAKRLELTVLEANVRAVQLYVRCGFSTEGTRQNSMCVDGKLANELYMSKLV